MIQIAQNEKKILMEIIQKRVPGAKISVFGSRSRGNAKKWSDLDIALFDTTPISPHTMMNIRLDLSESDLPWRVDILDWTSTDAAFKEYIAQDLILLV